MMELLSHHSAPPPARLGPHGLRHRIRKEVTQPKRSVAWLYFKRDHALTWKHHVDVLAKRGPGARSFDDQALIDVDHGIRHQVHGVVAPLCAWGIGGPD